MAAKLLCFGLAVAVHAGAVLALQADRQGKPAEQEHAIELEVVAATTRETMPSEAEDIAAAPALTEVAREATAGDEVTMLLEGVAGPLEVMPPGEMAEDAKAAELVKPTGDIEMVPPPADKIKEVTDVGPSDLALLQPDIAVPEAEHIEAASDAETLQEVPPAKAAPAKARNGEARKTKKTTRKAGARPSVAGTREAKAATRTGQSRASISGGARLSSSYRSVVMSRINGRKGAISSKIPKGAKGTVLISFVIGSGGSVSRSSVSRSSGNEAIDAAARAAVSGTMFPPPPEGRFSAVIPIRIN